MWILLAPDDLFALRTMNVYSEHSRSIPVRSKNPQEVWGACRNSRIGFVGQPQIIQMGEGEEWQSEVWTDLLSDGGIKLRFQVVGARPKDS